MQSLHFSLNASSAFFQDFVTAYRLQSFFIHNNLVTYKICENSPKQNSEFVVGFVVGFVEQHTSTQLEQELLISIATNLPNPKCI
jgi:hypothetical protein